MSCRVTRIRFVLFLWAIVFFAPWGFASTAQDEIQKLLAPYKKKVGFSLRDRSGKELFHVNGAQFFAPASVAKAVSVGCSLRELGPFFQYETVFGYRGKIEKGVLKGDLVIQGAGDPSFVIEDLKEILEKIRFVHGVQKIEGSLIFDVSYMGVKSLQLAEGFEGDNGRSFAADLTALPMNQNSFSFWAVVDPENAKTVLATTLPAHVVDVRITNKMVVKKSSGNSENFGDSGGAGGSSAASSGGPLVVSYDPSKQTATLSGAMVSGAEPKVIYRAVGDVYGYYLNLVARVWKDMGGVWGNPEYKIETQPVKMSLLYKHNSRPLGKILMDVNKLSLNMGAELTFLAAGVSAQGRPATYSKSLSLLKRCVREMGVADGEIQLTNASGLSREARVKPSALTLFLINHLRTPYAQEYVSSFSLMGFDGTAKTRLAGKYPGRVRVKTGSIQKVVSLAGYVYDKDFVPKSFVLIFNDVDRNDTSVKDVGDRIVEVLLR